MQHQNLVFDGGETERAIILRAGLDAKIKAIQYRLEIPLSGRRYIQESIVQPSRNVGGGSGNWSGKYPSAKVGVTQGFESRTLEYPAVLTLEHDDDCIAYFTQPAAIKVEYERPSGRRLAYRQTPDILVIQEDSIFLVECKPESEIAKRLESDSGFYEREGDHWVCPPARNTSRELGFEHVVWTEKSFPFGLIRNLRVLADYLRGGLDIPDQQAATASIRSLLNISVAKVIGDVLQELVDQVSIDHVYRGIALGELACDLDTDDVTDHRQCRLFRDQETLLAYRYSANAASRNSPVVRVDAVRGETISWNGATWKLVNVGTETVTLIAGDNMQELPRSLFGSLIRDGRIVSARPLAEQATAQMQKAYALLRQASPSDTAVANERFRRIQPFLAEGGPAPRSRTERRYVAAYRQARLALGSGFVGLLPSYRRCGNRRPRLTNDVLKIVEVLTDQQYLTPENRRAIHVHGAIREACEHEGLSAPSYAWYCKYLKGLDQWTIQRRRGGDKLAYAHAPRVCAPDGTIEPAANYPFEACHIDHTQVDVELVCSTTGQALGRPWLTLMIDVAARRVMASSLSFSAPSHRALMEVLRDCVRRNGRLPMAILFDGGKDFGSIRFDTMCAFFEIEQHRRPPARPRFGSHMERMFGTTNTNLFHNLLGNTQLRKNVRQMTSAVDPDKFAVWTLPALNEVLDRYFFEVYDTIEHRHLLDSPRNTFERLTLQFGARPERYIAYDASFLAETSPSTPKGTATVQPDGVKINYLYYNAPELRRHMTKRVDVRYDPFDLSSAFAYVDGRWLPLKSRHLALRNRTEMELKLLLEEYRKRRGDVESRRLSDTKLVRFLEEIRDHEALLLERRKAAEFRLARGECHDATDEAQAVPMDTRAEDEAALGGRYENSGDHLPEELELLGVY